MFAKLFRTSATIINSYEIARDLMEKRSANYSDRPHFIVLIEFYVGHFSPLQKLTHWPLGWDGEILSPPCYMVTNSGP